MAITAGFVGYSCIQNGALPVDPDPRFCYRALSRLKTLPKHMNPKDHDEGLIASSMGRWGFLDPAVLNERTEHVLGGNGRVETLLTLRHLGGERPTGIALAPDGDWLVPCYVVDLPESEEAAAALALNRTQELGGWDRAALAEVLTELSAQGGAARDGTGWAAGDLDARLREIAPTPGTAPAWNPDDERPMPPDEPRERDERHGRWVVCPRCGEGFTS